MERRLIVLERQQSAVGQQALSDKHIWGGISLAVLCWNIAGPLWSPCSACRGYRNRPYILMPVSQSKPCQMRWLISQDCPAILRLITWQSLWGPTTSAGPAGLNTTRANPWHLRHANCSKQHLAKITFMLELECG